MRDRLIHFAQTLIDQSAACTIVPPNQPSTGFWFGGGNMIEDADGSLVVVGRFRNHGDSRTGLGLGERGLELAAFRSTDKGKSFEKTLSLTKADLNLGDRTVLSIEGTALRRTADGYQLFVSTEKDGIGYPTRLESYLKPGTGVWTVDRICADSIAGLADAPVETILETDDPRFVHIKDPFLAESNGNATLLFCTHPFCWTSSNTGMVPLAADGSTDGEPVFDFFPRGFTWDVAMTRGTAVLPVPKVGDFADSDLKLIFYCGGECVRNLDEHSAAVKRPRGYSCEELGGVAYFEGNAWNGIERLSIEAPLFVSPHATGCSRYVDVLETADGFYATWQQAQADGSQPLVMNFVDRKTAEQTLA